MTGIVAAMLSVELTLLNKLNESLENDREFNKKNVKLLSKRQEDDDLCEKEQNTTD